MPHNQLIEYVRNQMASGSNQEKIRGDLKSSGGWSDEDINEAFNENGMPLVSQGVNNIPVAPTKYAGFWIRWVAFFVDSFIINIPLYALFFFLFGPEFFSGKETNLLLIILPTLIHVTVFYVYFISMTYTKGATLGKMLVGIHVVRDTSEKLSLGKIILRETVGKLLSAIIIGIGYLMVAFTDKKQGLHDKIAQTVVVYKNPSKGIHSGVWVAVGIAIILPILAVIGILSSVILASLNTAREKGADAEIKHGLTSLKIESELYAINNGDAYLPATDCFSGMFGEPAFASIISKSKSKSLSCKAYSDSYAVSAQLNNSGKYFCVDSKGYDGEGTLVDNGAQAYCESSSNTDVQITGDGQKITTSLYSIDLPAGWQTTQDSNFSSSAIRINPQGAFFVSTAEFPKEYPDVESIFDIATEKNIIDKVKSEVPDAVVKNVVFGLVQDIDAIRYTISISEKPDENGLVQKTFGVGYDFVKNRIMYTVLFMGEESEEGSLLFDEKAIIETFKLVE